MQNNEKIDNIELIFLLSSFHTHVHISMHAEIKTYKRH